MGERYDRVVEFEENLHQWAKGLFLEERMIFKEMAELMLKPIEYLPPVTEGEDGEKKSALLMLISRLFNDLESAKLLALTGLCEQAYMPLRDSIECMMLVRLFNVDDKRAIRWMKRPAQYSPGDAHKRLRELNTDAPEYGFYGSLSTLSHANLLGSLTHVEEVDLGDRNVIRRYHFGGFGNLKWISLHLQWALIHMLFALSDPLAQVYWPYLPNPHDWYEDVMALIPRLQNCGANIQAIWPEKPTRPERDREYERARRQVTAKLTVGLNYFDMDTINKSQ
jgi:hypothetical protein